MHLKGEVFKDSTLWKWCAENPNSPYSQSTAAVPAYQTEPPQGLLSVQQEGWLHPILWGGDLIHRGRLGGPTKSRRTRMSPSAFVGTKFECIAHIAPERKNLNYSSCFVIKLLPQALSLTLKAAWCCATLKDLRFLRA